MLTAATITDDDIRALYRDRASLSMDDQRACVTALSRTIPIAFDTRERARARCAEILNERMRASIPRCPGCGLPAHASETDDNNYHPHCTATDAELEALRDDETAPGLIRGAARGALTSPDRAYAERARARCAAYLLANGRKDT